MTPPERIISGREQTLACSLAAIRKRNASSRADSHGSLENDFSLSVASRYLYNRHSNPWVPVYLVPRFRHDETNETDETNMDKEKDDYSVARSNLRA